MVVLGGTLALFYKYGGIFVTELAADNINRNTNVTNVLVSVVLIVNNLWLGWNYERSCKLFLLQ